MKRFARLRTNINRTSWSGFPRNRAPYKPLLLLSVLDLFEQGRIGSNLIELTPDVMELFARYWARVMPAGRHGDLAQPFFYLRSDGFWHLVPQPGRENELAATENINSVARLRDLVIGVRLDDELYELLGLREPRGALRTVLVQTFFAPEMRPLLIEQGALNNEAFLYSEKLLQQAPGEVAETKIEEEAYQPAARDQGFRRAVVMAYDYRCALCGIRIVTFDRHTAVDASHIKPWSHSRDDRLINGMAL